MSLYVCGDRLVNQFSVGKHCHGLACSIACPQGTIKLLKMANIPRNEYPRQRTRQQVDTKHHTHIQFGECMNVIYPACILVTALISV